MRRYRSTHWSLHSEACLTCPRRQATGVDSILAATPMIMAIGQAACQALQGNDPCHWQRRHDDHVVPWAAWRGAKSPAHLVRLRLSG